MRSLFAILVGLLVFSMSMGSQIYALFGPCTTDVEPSYENTISCSGGDCSGHILILCIQRLCEDENDVPCDQDNNAPRSVTYDVVKTENLTIDYLLNIGLTGACAVFVMGIVALAGWSGVGAVIGSVALSVACGISGQEIINLIDACSFTTCDPDLNNKHYKYGGHSCD